MYVGEWWEYLHVSEIKEASAIKRIAFDFRRRQRTLNENRQGRKIWVRERVIVHCPTQNHKLG